MMEAPDYGQQRPPLDGASAEGETHIRIRPLEPEDLELLYHIENDPDIWQFSNSDAPYSRHALRQYLSSMRPMTESQELRMVIELRNGNATKRVGTIDLLNIDSFNAKAEVGIGLLHGLRHAGIGTRALLLIERIACERLRLHQLYALIAESNLSAARSFTKAGYKSIAHLPHWHFNKGVYENVVVFQKLLHEA